MAGTTYNLHVGLKQILKFDGKKADDFLNGVPSFVPVSAIFNILQGQERPSETDDSQATARAAWDAANQDIFSPVRRAAQRSSSYGDSRTPHSRMEQDMDSRHGQRCVRLLREFARSSSRGAFLNEQHAEGFRPGPGRVSLTSQIAVEIALMRATHQRVPQIVSVRILYCKLYRPNMRPYAKST